MAAHKTITRNLLPLNVVYVLRYVEGGGHR